MGTVVVRLGPHTVRPERLGLSLFRKVRVNVFRWFFFIYSVISYSLIINTILSFFKYCYSSCFFHSFFAFSCLPPSNSLSLCLPLPLSLSFSLSLSLSLSLSAVSLFLSPSLQQDHPSTGQDCSCLAMPTDDSPDQGQTSTQGPLNRPFSWSRCPEHKPLHVGPQWYTLMA